LKELNQRELEEKLARVIDKMMHLGDPDNSKDLESGGEAKGFFRRDFGIREWDWPQGVGLYGLLKVRKLQNRDEYRDFLYS